MKIAVLGGTRGIGRELVSQAIQTGHEVAVLARDPDRLTLVSERLTVQRGDAGDRDAVRSLVLGQQVIC